MYRTTSRSSSVLPVVAQPETGLFPAACDRDRRGELENEQQFEQLSAQYQLQVLGYIYANLRNMDDAEDVYQQTCLVMWRKFGEYQQGSDFLNWACTIARYELLNFIRSSKNRARYFSDDYLKYVAQSHGEDNTECTATRQQALRGCLDRLRSRDQQLVMQCYSGTDKIQDIARDMGRTPDSVYTSLRRIRRTLYECIRRTLASEGGHE